jgi:hypothetical protein
MTTEINQKRLAKFIEFAKSGKVKTQKKTLRLDMSEDELVEAAKHENRLVRGVVMAHHRTPARVLKVGAKDPEFLIRALVMSHKHTPNAILLQGLTDENKYVRAYAEKQIKHRRWWDDFVKGEIDARWCG